MTGPTLRVLLTSGIYTRGPRGGTSSGWTSFHRPQTLDGRSSISPRTSGSISNRGSRVPLREPNSVDKRTEALRRRASKATARRRIIENQHLRGTFSFLRYIIYATREILIPSIIHSSRTAEFVTVAKSRRRQVTRPSEPPATLLMLLIFIWEYTQSEAAVSSVAGRDFDVTVAMTMDFDSSWDL